jgi:hypothetical protein
MQHQNYIEVVRTLAVMFERLPARLQQRAEDLVLRILSALGDHVLTAGLDAALDNLVRVLMAAGRLETVEKVRIAHEQLKLSIGELNSRSTRVPQP